MLIRSVKPGLMPVKQYKRIARSLGETTDALDIRYLSQSTDGFEVRSGPVSKSGLCKLYDYRFLGHYGIVHSFQSSSEVDLYFSAASISKYCYPSDNITLTEANGVKSWKWKTNYIMTLTFTPNMTRKLLNPSSFTFTVSSGTEHYTKTIDIETCSNCEGCFKKE